jgi:hypothetical protein
MNRLEIDDLKSARHEGMSRHSAFIRLGAASREIYFKTAHSPVASSCDPFVPAVVLPAMQRKIDVIVRGPVSADILSAARRIQEIKSAWHPAWRIARLQAAGGTTAPEAPSSGTVGAFFSGGVDSFYTVQKHRAEITHLIFVSGFDVPLYRPKMVEMIAREVRKTAQEIGLPLIEVETNLRQFSDGTFFSWENQHGAALAAVAHLLAPAFGKIYIPSSYALPFLAPYGSHPGLDPLWSTQSLQVVHDDFDVTRFRKVGALSTWDTAVRNLRVCWELKEGQYNCCRCSKCMWTMAYLRAFGALERASSFPLPLDLTRLSEHPLYLIEHRHRFIQAIAELEERGDDPALVEALRKALNQGYSLERSVRRVMGKLRWQWYRQTRSAVRNLRYLTRSLRAKAHEG